jgi:type II secretory pathway pseudopilin PulG
MYKKNYKRNEYGSSLIEVVITFLIIVILVAVAIPVYASMQEAAQTVKAQQEQVEKDKADSKVSSGW